MKTSAFPISTCLGLSTTCTYALMPFALLYAWHECVQLVFVVVNWKETVPTLQQQGVEVMRPCEERERLLLSKVYAQTSKPITSSNEISWYNLCLIGEYSSDFEASSLKDEFVHWVGLMVQEFYPRQERKVISFGFINSPKGCTHDQPWHLDYGPEWSNLFVPMCELTIRNSTHFIRGPIKNMPANEKGSYNFSGGPNELMKLAGKEFLEVCQLVSKSFMILKLHTGVVHRGNIF